MSRYSLRPLIGTILPAGLAFILVGGYTCLQAQPQPQDSNSTPGATEPAPLLSPQQLDDLVAPIALYPDPLLSQVLVASTYPLEVVEAQQWLRQNNNLSGTQLMDAARQQNWDASVQALVALPDVLARLNQDVRWTTDLGNAFLAQQADVMIAVQRMRGRAQANGRLSSNAQQTVTDATQDGQQAIQIQPANPEIVYVPSYDPTYVWGPPAWGYYPPLYYPAFGFGFGPGINIGLCFGGWGGGWGGWGGWGWGPNWFGRTVIVNNTFFNRYGFRGGYAGGGFGGRTIWAHDPGHRLGVAYPNRQLTGRYQAASMASRANFRSGGQTFSNRSSGAAYGANRGGFQSARQGGSQVSGGRSGYQGSRYQGNSQSYRGAASQGAARNSQPQRSFQGGSQSAPRTYGQSPSRSFNGGGARSYSGSGASRSYSGGSSPSFSGGGSRSLNGGGSRSFSGGGARSYSSGGSSSGGGARSFGGGGGGHSFSGGGGARSFGGGGGSHSFSGGGGHSGGGSHGGGRK